MVVLRAGSIGGGNILYIDGAVCGGLRAVEGGAAFADVIEEPSVRGLVKKHVSKPRWEDLELQVDLSLSDRVYNWIAASWKGEVKPRDLAVTTVDAERNAVRRREFYRAFITGTTVPALDGASKDAGYLTLKLAFESARTLPGGGTVPPPPQPVRKQWVLENFRLELPGLDCTKVSKIDSFTVKQTVTTAKGDMPGLGLLSFPNLTVTLLEQGGETWQSWFDNFVLEGNNADGQEKTGKLTVLSPDLTKALARFDLFNVGIFRLAPEPQRAGGYPLPPRLVAGLYCERMDFSVA
jgi:hypothetical protein